MPIRDLYNDLKQKAGGDLTPGVDVSAGVDQWLTGRDRDIFPRFSLPGGDRSPAGPGSPTGTDGSPQDTSQDSFSQQDMARLNSQQRYSGGGGAGAGSNSDDLAYLSDQESQLRQLLQSAQNTLSQGLTNLSDSYNREQSSANQQRGRALENFGIQREDTTRGKNQALGGVDNNARTLNDSLRRMLGMASGTGSSAYQYAAPNAVARLASQNRTGVLSDYGANERDLALSEDRAKTDFEELLEDLARQRSQKESDLRAGVAEREQGIQRDLGNVAGERARLMGGGYNQIRSAQQPFQDAIGNRQSEIDSLFDRFRSPQYNVNPVNVQTPQLRDYMVDRQAINANNQEPSRYSPYRQFLNPRDEEEQLG